MIGKPKTEDMMATVVVFYIFGVLLMGIIAVSSAEIGKDKPPCEYVEIATPLKSLSSVIRGEGSGVFFLASGGMSYSENDYWYVFAQEGEGYRLRKLAPTDWLLMETNDSPPALLTYKLQEAGTCTRTKASPPSPPNKIIVPEGSILVEFDPNVAQTVR